VKACERMCRTYGAPDDFGERSQPFRAGLTSDAPTALSFGGRGFSRNIKWTEAKDERQRGTATVKGAGRDAGGTKG